MAKKLEYNTDYLFNYDVKESVNSVIDEVDGLIGSVNGLIDESVVTKTALVITGDASPDTLAAKALNVNGQIMMSRTETNANQTIRPVWFDLNYYIQPSASPSSLTDYHGFDLFGDVSEASYSMPLTNAQMYLFESKSFYTGTSFIGSNYAAFCEASNRSSGTIGNNVALRLWARNSGTGGINNNYAIRITGTQNSGTIVNNYGIHIGDITGATNSENNYAIYTGAGKVRFGGKVEMLSGVTIADALKLPQYSTATLPSPSQYTGCVASISDSTGKPSPLVYSNGVSWLYMNNATV